MRHNQIMSIADGVAVVDVSTPKYPGVVTRIDEADLHLITESPRRWCVSKGKAGLYVVRRLSKTKFERLHRVILGLTDESVKGDHIKHDTLDNRRSQLRRADAAQNRQNSRSMADAASGFLGVSRVSKSNTWRARIRCEGVLRHIGTFATEVEAAAAYDKEAAIEFGEFANLNFPKAVAA